MITTRRNKQFGWLRELIAEQNISVNDIILPVVVHELSNDNIKIESMPGVVRYSLSNIVEHAQRVYDTGIKMIFIFPFIDQSLKDEFGSDALNHNNVICKAVRLIKKHVPGLGVACDIALDPFTTHGQDGVIGVQAGQPYVMNSETCKFLVEQALNYARNGCDFIAPSDMMDSNTHVIRQALDKFGFEHVGIISYCAKYASCLYGPYRDAVGSKDCLAQSDKRTYQIDPANKKCAIRRMEQDVNANADMLIVKPALFYQDIISTLARSTNLPVLAFQVSGEYSMMSYGASHGLFDLKAVVFESFLSMKRAGATAVISYFGMDVAGWIG